MDRAGSVSGTQMQVGTWTIPFFKLVKFYVIVEVRRAQAAAPGTAAAVRAGAASLALRLLETFGCSASGVWEWEDRARSVSGRHMKVRTWMFPV